MIFQSYKKGDETKILELFSMVFVKQMSEAYWHWRFVENPLNQFFIHLAWDEGILASHYAASPILFSISGEDYFTIHSLTTMTHPEYRGLKLLNQLAKQVYDQAVKSDYLMVWGFPNFKSHRSFVKELNWKDLYEIPTMQLNLTNKKKECIADIVSDDHFDLDYVANSYLRQFIHVKKDRQYLRWRYAKNPVNHYTNLIVSKERKVSSFCVVKKYLNSLDIVDYQAQNEEEGASLLFQAMSFANLHKLDFVNCWAPRHHFIHSLCEKIGFINKEPITYLGFRQLSKNILKKISDNYSDWYIQMGDSDVY